MLSLYMEKWMTIVWYYPLLGPPNQVHLAIIHPSIVMYDWFHTFEMIFGWYLFQFILLKCMRPLVPYHTCHDVPGTLFLLILNQPAIHYTLWWENPFITLLYLHLMLYLGLFLGKLLLWYPYKNYSILLFPFCL